MIEGKQVVLLNDCTTSSGQLWTRTAGAYRIATELRSIGVTVQVIDFFSHIMLEGEELWKLLLDKFVGSSTLIVGMSTTFQSNALYKLVNHPWGSLSGRGHNRSYAGLPYGGIDESEMVKVKNYVRSINSKTKLVSGGAYATENEQIWDIICYGYGEVHVKDLVNWMQGKNPFFRYRIVNGQMILDYDNKASNFDFNSSTIAWQAEDCIQPGEALPIEISRGCIFKCKFCYFPLNGKKKLDFIKDGAHLRDELQRNYELFGTTRYIFSDDTYNDTTHKLEFMNGITESLPFNLEFATYARLDLITAHPEHIELLQQNGVKSVLFGIESLNKQAAASIGKGMDPERIVDTLYKLREAWGNNVIVQSGFIAGLPHDTYKAMEKWVEQLVRPGFPLHGFSFSPLAIRKSERKVYLSEFEANPSSFGYNLIDGGWTNDLYETTFDGCDELSSQVRLYSLLNGGQQVPSHTIMNLPMLGIGYDECLKKTMQGITIDEALFNKTRSVFLNYLTDLFALETA